MARVVVRKQWHGERILAQTRAGEVRGLELSTQWLLGESRAIVPLDEGPLLRSGEASVDASQRKGAVSYNTVYAPRQHEELTWRHDPGRQAKYLETPWMAGRDTMNAIIAGQIRQSLGIA